MVASRALGGAVAVTGEAGVWSRAFHKRCGCCAVWNVPVILFVAQRRPTWECITVPTLCTSGAREAIPIVGVFARVVQVIISFAAAPRRQFTPSTLVVGYFSGWAR